MRNKLKLVGIVAALIIGMVIYKDRFERNEAKKNKKPSKAG